MREWYSVIRLKKKSFLGLIISWLKYSVFPKSVFYFNYTFYLTLSLKPFSVICSLEIWKISNVPVCTAVLVFPLAYDGMWRVSCWIIVASKCLSQVITIQTIKFGIWCPTLMFLFNKFLFNVAKTYIHFEIYWTVCPGTYTTYRNW